MIGNSEKVGEFNFADIVEFLNAYKKQIFIITLAAGVLALIFSHPFFMHPKYKSNVIIYPTRTNSPSRAILSTTADQHDILAFGQEAEAEQLLQILESDEITDRIARRFSLMEHYRIEPNSNYPRTSLLKEFKDNVKYRRTEYMSIEIVVLDESRDTAARMANDIASLMDSVKTRIQQEHATKALAIVKTKYEEKQMFIHQLVDSLQVLGSLGVLNYTDQPAVLTEQYAKALLAGNTQVANEIKVQERNLAIYGPIHKAISDEIVSDVNQLTDLESKYNQAKVDAEEALSHKFVIQKGVPAEKKSYPLRSLIVLISMGSAFASSVLIFAFVSNFKKYRKRKAIVPAEEKFFAEV